MHFIFICIHLICAIFFIAYVFFDVCVYCFAYKHESKEDCDKIIKKPIPNQVFLFLLVFLSYFY